MTTEEKEKIISDWPYPWPELVSLYQQSRDLRIEHADSDDEQERIREEYREAINRIYSHARRGPSR